MAVTYGVVAVIAVLSLASACGDEDGPSESPSISQGYSVTDSSGVRIVATSKEVMDRELDWSLDSVPDLIIGDGNSPEEQFFGIAGLAQLPDGRLVAVDQGSGEVRFFGQDGALAATFGGKGSGPGEFDSPELVPGLFADSMVVYDRRLRRYHVLSTIDFGFRSLPADGFPQRRPIGLWHNRIFFQRSFSPRPTGLGVSVREVVHGWIGLDGSKEIIVDSSSVPLFLITKWEGRIATETFEIPFTLSPRPPAAVAIGTAIVAGRGPYLREFDTDGKLVSRFGAPETARRVTGALIDSVLVDWARRARRPSDEYEDALGQMALADTLPPYERVMADDMGWIWAARYTVDYAEPRTWFVFDLDRRGRGRVTTPPGVEIRQIGRNFLLGVWTDSMGVQQVRRYTFHRELR